MMQTSTKAMIPPDIHHGALADTQPWNTAPHRPYALPDRVKVLAVRTGGSATGIQVLVDTGDSLLGERWMDAAWFTWPTTQFL